VLAYFVRDELAIPAEQCLRSDERAELAQAARPDLLRGGRQPSALGVREVEPARAVELAEHGDLGLQVGDHVLLLTVHPADEQQHEELERVGQPHDQGPRQEGWRRGRVRANGVGVAE
jgi:hypothetical protein